MQSVKRLLSRYFIGIGLQVTGILILITLGMSIVGLGFKRSLLIGLIAAILNVVPYLGPLIGTSLGILLGIAFNINLEFSALLPMAGYMLMVFLAAQAIDNILFQPLIFSNSCQCPSARDISGDTDCGKHGRCYRNDTGHSRIYHSEGFCKRVPQ